MNSFVVDNPATGAPYCERRYASAEDIPQVTGRARRAHLEWRDVPLAERIALVRRVGEISESRTAGIAADITGQMGKPIQQAEAEVRGMLARLRSLCDQAPAALGDVVLPDKPGFRRRVSREPLGVVLDIAAWNYPLLVPVNVVVAAVLAGNAVLIKHSPRTPLCGEMFEHAFRDAGAPDGLVTAFLVDHPTAADLIGREEVGHVCFTGSVAGGRQVYQVVSKRLIGIGLELGGKDAAYVCRDADLDFAAAETAEGAFYNAGQSCCAVERIYVDESVYPEFVERFVAVAKSAWRLGDPTDRQTTLGPLALPQAIGRLERQVRQATELGGRLLLGGAATQVDGAGRFFQPTVISEATDDMLLMGEESFGPVIGLSRVADEAEAVARINDSPFGLTCSIWSTDPARAERIGEGIDVGTVFMNRCDVLDPELPWTGVKESGFGSTLGHAGFHQLTRPKSWHFRTGG